MDILFTENEMKDSCYMKTPRSSKPGLEKEKIELLEGEACIHMCILHGHYILSLSLTHSLTHSLTCSLTHTPTHVHGAICICFIRICIKIKFGAKKFEEYSSAIRKKCTQKCIDKSRKKIKEEEVL